MSVAYLVLPRHPLPQSRPQARRSTHRLLRPANFDRLPPAPSPWYRAAQPASGIVDPPASEGWAPIPADVAGIRPNLVTALYARRIANWQRPDGHSPTIDTRPLQSHSLFTATAVAMRALRLDMLVQLRNETDQRPARGKARLLAAKPRNAFVHHPRAAL